MGLGEKLPSETRLASLPSLNRGVNDFLSRAEQKLVQKIEARQPKMGLALPSRLDFFPSFPPFFLLSFKRQLVAAFSRLNFFFKSAREPHGQAQAGARPGTPRWGRAEPRLELFARWATGSPSPRVIFSSLVKPNIFDRAKARLDSQARKKVCSCYPSFKFQVESRLDSLTFLKLSVKIFFFLSMCFILIL